MRNKRVVVLTVLMLVTALLFVGCGNQAQEQVSAEKAESRVIIDGLGREVEIPGTINKIVPAGAVAQTMLYTINPDLLVGLAKDLTQDNKQYMDEKYSNLPIFGQFYGKSANLNREAVIEAGPDLIIDIGEVKGNIVSDLDSLQEQLGIPVVFFPSAMEEMADSYVALGEVLEEEERCQQLADYVTKTIEETEKRAAKITSEQQVSIYYGDGPTGMEGNPVGSIHADVIDYVGGKNVVDFQQPVAGGYNEISMEQILQWNPEVIILGPGSIYDTIGQDPLWKDIKAVQDGRYYEIPAAPYNWMGRPPSVNRIIGMKWLGYLLYPEVYDYDMVEETKNFYQLFYHYSLTDEEVKDLLEKAIAKN